MTALLPTRRILRAAPALLARCLGPSPVAMARGRRAVLWQPLCASPARHESLWTKLLGGEEAIAARKRRVRHGTVDMQLPAP